MFLFIKFDWLITQDKKMCAMGVYDHELYDEDYLGNLNMWDFPGEEGDGCLPDDFASKLGPIPFPSEMLPSVGTDLLGFGTVSSFLFKVIWWVVLKFVSFVV